MRLQHFGVYSTRNPKFFVPSQRPRLSWRMHVDAPDSSWRGCIFRNALPAQVVLQRIKRLLPSGDIPAGVTQNAVVGADGQLGGRNGIRQDVLFGGRIGVFLSQTKARSDAVVAVRQVHRWDGVEQGFKVAGFTRSNQPHRVVDEVGCAEVQVREMRRGP